MHDLLQDFPTSPDKNLSLDSDNYSAYALGMYFGILGVALYLSVGIMAAANISMASHLSIRPPQKELVIEGRLIFCMMVLFGAAIASGSSLFLLSINIDPTFAVGVGVSFLSGVGIATYHVLTLFGIDWLKRMSNTPLPVSSLVVSTVTFVLAIVRARNHIVFLTILAYYITLTYQLLVVSQSIPDPANHRNVRQIWTSMICIPWAFNSLLWLISFFTWSNRDPVTIVVCIASGLEAIIIASHWPFVAWKKRRRLQMNSAEA